MLNSQTNKLMEKTVPYREKHGFCMLPASERSKDPYQLDLLNDNFDHPHVNVITLVPENS